MSKDQWQGWVIFAERWTFFLALINCAVSYCESFVSLWRHWQLLHPEHWIKASIQIYTCIKHICRHIHKPFKACGHVCDLDEASCLQMFSSLLLAEKSQTATPFDTLKGFWKGLFRIRLWVLLNQISKLPFMHITLKRWQCDWTIVNIWKLYCGHYYSEIDLSGLGLRIPVTQLQKNE